MKKEWLSATLLTIACLVILNGGFTAIVWGVSKLTPQKGLAERIKKIDGTYYYVNIAQKFTDDKYFWPRPSAVDYNATASGGSNKGPTNPDYLKTVSDRIDSFLAHNPSVKRSGVPAELLTASGSGLDPDISIASAEAQIARVAQARGISEKAIRSVVIRSTLKGIVGLNPGRINVLVLNINIDKLK